MKPLLACCALLVLGALPPAAARAQPPQAGAAGDAVEQQVRRMERELERAVNRGVSAVEQQLPARVPGLLFFVGSIQARGFVLDDYGLFFYVEYPVVRRSLLWSMGVLDPFGAGRGPALADFRRWMPGGPAAPRPSPAAPATPVPPVTIGAEPPGDARAERPAPLAVDPETLYRSALRDALTNALLAHGGALPGVLGAFDWLTVAARDGRGVRVAPGGSRTLQIRVRGGDLAALRDGRLSVDEVRGRVETR